MTVYHRCTYHIELNVLPPVGSPPFFFLHPVTGLPFAKQLIPTSTIFNILHRIRFPLEPDGSLSMSKIGLGMPGDKIIVRHKFNLGHMCILAIESADRIA